MRILIFVLILINSLGCQGTSLKLPNVSEEQFTPKYSEIKSLRTRYLMSKDFIINHKRLIELEKQALSLAEDEPLKLGAIGTAILDTYYGSLTGHYALTKFYQYVGSSEANLHSAWLRTIENYISKKADGSEEKPIAAISANEAFAYIFNRNADPVGSIYQTSKRKPLTLLVQAREKDGKIKTLHFDLSQSYQAMENASPSDQDQYFPSSFLQGLATQGDSAAQAAIGAYLVSQRSLDQAVNWLQAASGRGNLVANSFLAGIFWEQAQEANDPNAKKASMELLEENYQHAIALGSSNAMTELGILYIRGEYGENKISEGRNLLTEASENGNPLSTYVLARIHDQFSKTKDDQKLAISLYKRAADLGHTDAKLAYASYTISQKIKDERTIVWLEELSKNKNPKAMLLLGYCYAHGLGVDLDFQKTFRWFRRSVDQDPLDAHIVNEVVWSLIATQLRSDRRVKYGVRTMNRLMKTNKEALQEPAYLDTWAASHAANGNFTKAIAIQKRAIELANNDNLLEILTEHLNIFEAGGVIMEKIR